MTKSKKTGEEIYSVPDPLGIGEVEVLGASNLFGVESPPRKGKIRDVYDRGDDLLIVTTDRISAFDVVYPTLIPHKGKSLHALSEYWFKRTGDICPNHYIETLDERTMRVVKAERVDVEWVCRAYLYGSAWRAYRGGAREVSGVKLPNGLVMAEELPDVIITPTTKSDTGHDEEITRDQAIEEGLVTSDEWRELEEATFKLFEFYRRRTSDPRFRQVLGGEVLRARERAGGHMSGQGVPPGVPAPDGLHWRRPATCDPFTRCERGVEALRGLVSSSSGSKDLD
jgi:hypothetical protein